MKWGFHASNSNGWFHLADNQEKSWFAGGEEPDYPLLLTDVGYVSHVGWMMGVTANEPAAGATTIFRRSLTNRIGSRSAIS